MPGSTSTGVPMTEKGSYTYLMELRSVIAMVQAAPDDAHENHLVRVAAQELVGLLDQRNVLAAARMGARSGAGQ
jgi:hypothetical protein